MEKNEIFKFSETRPLLSELDFENKLLNKLISIDINEMPNLLVYGQNSSGKTTMINAFLATKFGRNFYDMKNITMEIDRKTFNYKTSSYHLEFCAKEMGTNDKIFIHDFIKTYIETRNIGLDIPKIVIIRNASTLTSIAQMALRRIIEKNTFTSRFIFENNSLSSFQDPLISRCLLINVKTPSIDEIKLSLKKLSDGGKELFNYDELIKKSVNHDITQSYNLKKIYGEFFHYKYTNTPFVYYYDNLIFELFELVNAKKILMTNLDKIKDIINELYINLYPMKELIIRAYNYYFKYHSNNNIFIDQLTTLTINTDINMCKGNKECIHTEYYFIALFELLLNLKTA